jgi:DNA-binding protein YbaB
MKFDIAAGFHPISGIRIDPALLDPSRAVDVAALLVEATNAAQQQALELAEEAINDAIVPEEEEEPDENTEELVLATEHLAEATRLAREALAETVVIGQASGGAARIVMNASGEVQMVYLRLDLVRPERAAELERAYIEAYEDAEAQARAYWQEFMQAITSPDEDA